MIKKLTCVMTCNKLFQLQSNALKNFLGTVMNMLEHEIMTIEEVADYLRVKKRTVYEWVKTGKIPAIKTVGQWRFKKAKIDAWLDSQME